MAVESVSAAEILIQRFACYTTTLHIFSFFYQQWDSKARRKFREWLIIDFYIHTRTHTYTWLWRRVCICTHMCCTWILHYMCIPSLLCHFIGYSTPRDVVPLFIPSPNSNDSTAYSIERRQTEHSFDSDALCVSRLPHEYLQYDNFVVFLPVIWIRLHLGSNLFFPLPNANCIIDFSIRVGFRGQGSLMGLKMASKFIFESIVISGKSRSRLLLELDRSKRYAMRSHIVALSLFLDKERSFSSL